MLIDEVERLEEENTVLIDFRDKYFASEQRVTSLTERNKKSIAGESFSEGVSPWLVQLSVTRPQHGAISQAASSHSCLESF
jgi:hypothetical protein